MAFFEQRLPDKFSFGAKGGPVFSTTAKKTQGGQRYANRNWLYPIQAYDISNAIRNETDFQELRAFFYVVGGQGDGFRFRAPDDFKASIAEGQMSLIGGSVYQLLKAYVAGSRTFLRPIYKPASDFPLTAYRTRSSVQSVISPTIDYSTGQVTVSGHVSGDTYQWAGPFDIPVAFTNDKMDVELTARNGGGLLLTWPDVTVEEFRL